MEPARRVLDPPVALCLVGGLVLMLLLGVSQVSSSKLAALRPGKGPGHLTCFELLSGPNLLAS
jgi:hypothetical protein